MSIGRRLSIMGYLMRHLSIICGLLLTATFTGCSTLGNDYGAIPVGRLPVQLLNGERKKDFEDVSFLRLRQDPPEVHRLGPGDILGINIQGVTGAEDVLPPVEYRTESGLPPAIGYPVPVREDGTVGLPLAEPVNVDGLTLVEATGKIRDEYVRSGVLKEEKASTIVTLIKQRTVRVMVIREESGGLAEVTKRGTGFVLDLPAYENDVLHALNQTGGLPGTDARNEVLIYRGMYTDAAQYDQLVNSLCGCENLDPCYCDERPKPDPPNLVRIPLRYNPTNPPTFTEDDIKLNEGDIVVIRARDNEVFYTGGLLGGREVPLPRDRDLDVMAAIALAGGPLGSIGTGVGGIGGRGGGGGFGGGFGGGGGQGGYCQPSKLIVLRELPCGQQLAIKVDLNEAIRDPSQRILVQPNDVLLLQYTLGEEVGNVALSLIQFNYFLGNGLR